MRSPTRAALALALAATACSSSRTAVSAGVVAPTAVATFLGLTTRYANLHPYVAVASGSGGELRIIDPQEDRPVFGPTLVFPLSVPTNPRPLWLAAASLADDGADLLAVASPSTTTGPTIEIVVTWQANNRIDPSGVVAIPDAGPESDVLSLTAGPISDAAGVAIPGRARLVVGLATPTGGRLAVIDVTRGANGTVVAGTPVVAPLLAAGASFDPLDLAFSPAGDHLFIATTDPLGTVRGVAQLDIPPAIAAPAPSTWTLTPLDARDGTTKVATAVLVEKLLVSPAGGAAGRDDFPGAGAVAQLRVYAALDPAGCGDTRRIRCGIATLVPGAGLATDPTHEIAVALDSASTKGMPYRAPLELALGLPTALATSGPPTDPALSGSICKDEPVTRLRIAPALGQRCTTAMALIASSDGNSYIADLGRFQIPSQQAVFSDTASSTRVVSAASTLPVGVNGVALGLLAANGAQVFDATSLPAAVKVTPGYTPIETFTLEWQGVLPGVLGVPGIVMRDASGVLLAAQADSGRRGPNGEIIWLAGLKVSSPSVAVHPGDLAEVQTLDDVGLCPGDAVGARVAGSGGVIEVLADDAGAATPTRPAGALRIDDGCYASGLAVGQSRRVLFNVRASGLVLSGAGLGYLGRPTFSEQYALGYSSTADSPDAADDPQSEAQLLARKARRRFYPTDQSGCDGTACNGFGLKYNLDEGPVLVFTPVHGGLSTDLPPQGAALTLVTDSGYRPFTARPIGASLPVSATRVDRSAPPLSQNLEIRWYIAYSDDAIFVFGPAEAANQPFSIR